MVARDKFLQWGWIVATMLIAAPASAEVNCAFSLRSTFEGVDHLDSHKFRIALSGDDLALEQRFADGSWHSLGSVQRNSGPEFTIFQLVPEQSNGVASVLTIHLSGSASLVQHHGRTGNAQQLERAWLYHGSCEKG